MGIVGQGVQSHPQAARLGMIVVHGADDFVMSCQREAETKRFLEERRGLAAMWSIPSSVLFIGQAQHCVDRVNGLPGPGDERILVRDMQGRLLG